MTWPASATVTIVAALMPLTLAASPSPTPLAPTGAAPAGLGAPTPPANTGSPTAGTPSPGSRILGRPPSPGGARARLPVFSPRLEWPLASLHAGLLWRHTLGGGVTVAVVDTGIDLRQPDLAGAVSAVQDLTSRKSPDDGSDVSSDSHGTAVAGIIGARGSNAGEPPIAGLAPQSSLLDIRVAIQPDLVTTAAAARGITAGVRKGAGIINVSLVIPSASPALGRAVSLAQSRHCLIVAAAGSAGAPQALAAYPGVLTVAAVGQSGAPVTPGAGATATVSAPGADLFSTARMKHVAAGVHGYVQGISGTGYAAAYVSAAAALLLAADRKLSPVAAGRLLTRTAHQTAPRSAPAIDPLAALDSALRRPAAATGNGGIPALPVAGGLAAVLLAGLILMLRNRSRRVTATAGPPPISLPSSSWDQPW